MTEERPLTVGQRAIAEIMAGREPKPTIVRPEKRAVAAVPAVPIGVGVSRERKMNRTERLYGERLQTRVRSGEVLGYWYEGCTLKLAPDTRYTADYLVMLASHELELHECKGGFTREDSWIKLKLAASMFPFRFFLCKYVKGEWDIKCV